jgi:hypothetical protein
VLSSYLNKCMGCEGIVCTEACPRKGLSLIWELLCCYGVTVKGGWLHCSMHMQTSLTIIAGLSDWKDTFGRLFLCPLIYLQLGEQLFTVGETEREDPLSLLLTARGVNSVFWWSWMNEYCTALSSWLLWPWVSNGTFTVSVLCYTWSICREGQKYSCNHAF